MGNIFSKLQSSVKAPAAVAGQKNTPLSPPIKNKLLDVIAHDLIGEMYGLMKISADLELADQKNEALGEMIYDCRNSIIAHIQFVNSLLEYWRLDAGQAQPQKQIVETRALIDRVIQSQRYAAGEKEVKVQVTINDDLPRQLITDEFRLRNVLCNLLSNAITHSKREGSISLRVESIERGKILFCIRDGRGNVTSKEQRSMFKPFVLKESGTECYKKQNLNLFIAAWITDTLLKGTLSGEPDHAGGFKMYLTIPIKL
ncbi:sensor histidine kinase [Dinghuibacter silviterrae]|nr:HAMP domain-containing sensor histidine kinase [Dinghuibacter silviterrae]